MDWIEVAGYVASGLVFCTFCMKTMIPLRIVAIASNAAFIVFGYFAAIYPVLRQAEMGQPAVAVRRMV